MEKMLKVAAALEVLARNVALQSDERKVVLEGAAALREAVAEVQSEVVNDDTEQSQ